MSHPGSLTWDYGLFPYLALPRSISLPRTLCPYWLVLWPLLVGVVTQRERSGGRPAGPKCDIARGNAR